MPHTSDDGERILAIFHEHWVRYARLVLVYLLMLAVSALFFYLAGLSAYHYEWTTQALLLAAVGLLLATHHWFFIAALSQAENHIIITSDRVIWVRHRLFFDDEMHEYTFEKMKTAGASKTGFLQYIFRYGTLEFESGEPIPYVPHPNNAIRIVEQAMGMK
jgi:hypothetical protein